MTIAITGCVTKNFPMASHFVGGGVEALGAGTVAPGAGACTFRRCDLCSFQRAKPLFGDGREQFLTS